MICEHKWVPIEWISDVKDTDGVDLEIQCKKCDEVKILKSCRVIGYNDPHYKDPPGIETIEVKWKVEYD